MPRSESEPSEKSEAQRRPLPWFTAALCLGMLAAFGALRVEFGESLRRARQSRADLLEFYAQNSQVEVDAWSRVLVGDWRVARADADRDEAGAGVAPSIQREFDRLAVQTARLAADQPESRWGVADASAPPANFLAHAAVHTDAPSLALGIAVLLLVGVGLELAWGTLIFAGFCLVATPAVAAAFAAFHPGSFPSWAGSAGLCAALIGASCLRSLQRTAKRFSGVLVPSWLVLPAWLGADLLVARGFDWRALAEAPVLAHAAGLGVGAVGAIAIWVLGVEQRRAAREKEMPELVSNPLLDRAMAAREAGRWSEAFDLLKSGTERSPRNRDLALAFWDVSRASERRAEAAPGLLPVIEGRLREGDRAGAVRLWLELCEALTEFSASTPTRVRVGEALLDEGHPEAAVSALRSALEGSAGVGAAQAMRIVRIARDLDPTLAGQAARAALADKTLDPSVREDMESLAAASPAEPLREPSADSGIEAELDAGAQSQSVHSEPGDELDPDALSVDDVAIEALPAGENVSELDVERWNDPSLIEDLSGELDDATLEEDPTLPETLHAPSPTAAEVDTAVQLGAPEPIVAPVLRPGLKLRAVLPIRLEARGIACELEDGSKMLIPFDRIEAIAVGAVSGLASKPVLVIDWVLNWSAASSESLRVIRLRSDRFDPRPLAENEENSLAAMRQFLAELSRRSEATALPHAEGVRGAPFATFESLAAYERAVLRTESSS